MGHPSPERRQKVIEWLVANKELWPKDELGIMALIAKAKSDGLWSENTMAMDVRRSLNRYLPMAMELDARNAGSGAGDSSVPNLRSGTEKR